MRCPSCGQDVDPAHAFCPNCRTSLQLPAAPSSPYGGGQPPSYSGPEYSQPYHTQPQWADQGYPQPPGYGQPQAYVPQQGYDPTQQHYGVHPPAGVPQETGWSGNYQVLEPGPPPERPRSSMIWLVVAIAALLVVAGAAVAVWKLAAKHPPLASQSAAASTGATSPAQPAADGKAQALAIDQLLNASSASRQKLAPALTAVDGCGDLNGAVTTLQQVTTERDGQVKQGQSLAVDQLTNGHRLGPGRRAGRVQRPCSARRQLHRRAGRVGLGDHCEAAVRGAVEPDRQDLWPAEPVGVHGLTAV